MGIEPTSDSDCRSTVLKTAAPTRTQTPPRANLPALSRLPVVAAAVRRSGVQEQMSRADGAEQPLADAGGACDAQRRALAGQRPSRPLDVPQRDAVEEDHAGHVDDEIA